VRDPKLKLTATRHTYEDLCLQLAAATSATVPAVALFGNEDRQRARWAVERCNVQIVVGAPLRVIPDG